MEGPLFGSYLALREELESRGIDVKGYFAEYSHREANLMQSMINANSDSLLKNSRLDNRNIDDLILLDFVQNPEVVIKRTNKGEVVSYKNEKIDIDEYHLILEFLENEDKVDNKKLASEFGVSQEFLDQINDRYEGKFDIVFLDYYSGLSERRQKVLNRLMYRLNDEAVVGITTNVTPRINHSRIDKQDIGVYQMLQVLDSMEGLDILEYDEHPPYVEEGKEQEIGFSVFKVRKEGKLSGKK